MKSVVLTAYGQKLSYMFVIVLLELIRSCNFEIMEAQVISHIYSLSCLGFTV